MEKLKDVKIVFFGTPEFAVESLKALVNSGYDIAAVVTMPDKPAGRGHKMYQSDVKKFAEKRGLPVLQPEKLRDPDFIAKLREINADLFIVIAFRMLPEVVWSMPRLGTFNLHGSLLPAYRGAAPINRAIMNGETETGVTTFLLSHNIDTGNILRCASIEIGPDENAGSVHDRLMMAGSDLVLLTCADLISGRANPVAQPEGDFPGAPKIFRDTCRIDWSKSTAEVHNHIRGLSPYPAAWSTIQCDGTESVIKIMKSKLSDRHKTAPAGSIEIEKQRMFVSCGDGWLEILEVQPAGKRVMETSSWLLGHKPEVFKQ